MLDFRILGELEVVDGERRLALGGAKQRAVLAVLVIHRDEAVSTDRLIDELWGEQPPATAAKTVQVYVSHLRKALGDGVLVTRGRGYALDVGDDRVDAGRFERLAATGREQLRAGDPAAAATLREALALWRGPALADFAYEPFAQTEAGRLEEARLAALEDRIEADLAGGEAGGLVAELEALVDRHPLRERLQGQLMLALYRSGRQAEALERYRSARASLQEGLGIEPSRELQDLHRRILEQDRELDRPARAPVAARLTGGRGMRRGAVVVIVGGLLLLGIAIGAIVSAGGGEPAIELRPNSVAVVDPESGEVEDEIPVGARPSEISFGEGAIWVANLDDESVSQVDPAEREVVGTAVTGGAISGMAAGEGGIWVTDTRRGVISKIDPRFRQVIDTTRIGPVTEFAGHNGPVGIGGGAVWAGDGGAAIVRIDPGAGRVVGESNVGNSPTGLAVDDTDVWVADDVDNTVTRISARGAPTVTRTISVGPGARGVAVGEDAIWVTESQTDQVARIDPVTGAVTDTIEVGRLPTGIAAGEGAVWVANSVSGTLSRIDPDSREVDLTVELGQSPQSLALAEGRLWATLNESVAPPPAAEDEEGGTMRVLLKDDPDLDPATAASDPARGYATCAGLYNYPDAPAPAGSTLEPEVAAGPAEVSDGGRTYTFRIRPGYAFSPPSNEPVTAASFEREIERVLSPELGAFAAETIQEIVGAKAFARNPNGDLTGVRADGDELVIRLTRPVPDFLARISTPQFCAVPEDTPTRLRGSAVIPTAGPYYVAEYVPQQRAVLRRNPNYQGPRPAELAQIYYEIGFPVERAIAEVESGDADLYADADPLGNAIPPDQVRRLDRLYGAQSDAAAAGVQRLFIGPQLTVEYLILNSSRPPFDDPRVRRAINYAVDRAALAREPFPGATGRPTDQALPPGLPGFADAAIYPLGGPDVERARELAGELDTRAVLYVCDLPPCLKLGETLRANLAPIGIDVEVRSFPIPEMFERINTGEPFDIALYGWIADYPDPFDFINAQFHPDIGLLNPEPFSHSFDGTDLLDRMTDAAALTGDERYQAYAELDRDLMAEAAPIVPYASGTNVSFFSERIGCQVEQPIYGIDLGRLCLR